MCESAESKQKCAKYVTEHKDKERTKEKSGFDDKPDSELVLRCKELHIDKCGTCKPAPYPEGAWKKVCEIKALRERATTTAAQEYLDRIVDKHYRACHQAEMYRVALMFLLEKWYNCYMKKDLKSANNFLADKIFPYSQKHNVDTWCFESMCHLREAYMLAHRKDTEKALSKIDILKHDSDFIGNNIGKHYINYCLGSCLMGVLKNNYSFSLYNRCVSRFETVALEGKDYEELVVTRKVRDLAVDAFEKSRQMLYNSIEEKTPKHTLKAAYLKDESKQFYPLLHMAHLFLYFPTLSRYRDLQVQICTQCDVISRRLFKKNTRCKNINFK